MTGALILAIPSIGSTQDIGVSSLMPSYEQCLEEKAKLREEAKAKSDAAWSRVKATPWSSKAWPMANKVAADYYREADLIRKKADRIRCILPKPSGGEENVNLKSFYESLKVLRRIALKDSPGTTRKIIKESLKEVEDRSLKTAATMNDISRRILAEKQSEAVQRPPRPEPLPVPRQVENGIQPRVPAPTAQSATQGACPVRPAVFYDECMFSRNCHHQAGDCGCGAAMSAHFRIYTGRCEATWRAQTR
ncbi:hypothetical protein [Methylorubrum extorquens]